MEYSVLMAVYRGTKVEYFKKSIESMLSQTVLSNDIVIVKDGEITNELLDVLNKYKEIYPNIINIVELHQNVGLGKALKDGLLQCKNELVARMDDDDIAYPDRCNRLLTEFVNNPTLDLLGSYIHEFCDNENQIVSTRRVPISLDEIRKFSRRKSPFNHVSVMFRKSKVISCGSYSEYRTNQDVELWIRMIHQGCNMRNIPDALVKVRYDRDTFKRRKNSKNIRLMISIWNGFYKKGYCSYIDYLYVLSTQLIIKFMPNIILSLLQKIFRKNRY